MPNAARKPIKSPAPAVPHSWTIAKWPPEVYPNDPNRAKYLVREHRHALTAHGALTRPGRELVILGKGYAMWLASGAPRVNNFIIAPNLAKEQATA